MSKNAKFFLGLTVGGTFLLSCTLIYIHYNESLIKRLQSSEWVFTNDENNTFIGEFTENNLTVGTKTMFSCNYSFNDKDNSISFIGKNNLSEDQYKKYKIKNYKNGYQFIPLNNAADKWGGFKLFPYKENILINEE